MEYNVLMANLRQTLIAWRDGEAAKKGIELFRVLPNSAIDEIIKVMPHDKESLTSIKGIKEAKYAQYGTAILAMVKEHSGSQNERSAKTEHPAELESIRSKLAHLHEERPAYSVSDYLDIINRELSRMRARVRGEITSFKFQGSAVYFAVADEKDASTLNVFMWQTDLALSGVELSEGLVVTLEGKSEIYKPSGRFSFRAETIELFGEGALKKAYDDLKKKLDAEGLFTVDKKRQLRPYPTKIGLITSRSGAVIHDFLNNLGRYGFKITFIDSRVEGAMAVKDLLDAIETLKTHELDALVLIRGGGSLESLQAFNNEAVVRAIADFPAVTIAAIGHDKDVPLVQLAADHAPSTPTATTFLLNESWEALTHEIKEIEQKMISRYELSLWQQKDLLRETAYLIETRLKDVLSEARAVLSSFSDLPNAFLAHFQLLRERMGNTERILLDAGDRILRDTKKLIDVSHETLRFNDPARLLRLGYSILSKNGTILRNMGQVSVGESFEARLSDGTLVAEITEKRQ